MRFPLYLIVAIQIILPGSSITAQKLLINEVVAKNSSIISDADGDFPDWIELINVSATPVNLNGYGLSDEKDNLSKWTLPDFRLGGFEHLLVFASDKDRSVQVFWDLVAGEGDDWAYKPGDSSIPDSWFDNNYSDSGWDIGPSGFGYGDEDDATEVRGTSVYIRKRFVLEDIENISIAIFQIDFDDGYIAYLNGHEIARENMGSPGQIKRFNQLATGLHEAALYQGLQTSDTVLENVSEILIEGENILAVQGHNANTGSSDMTLNPFFSVGRSNKQSINRTPPEFLGLEISALHTNFKIKSSGESLYLSDATQVLLDSVALPFLPSDISFGRYPDGTDTWALLAEPTPGQTNLPTQFRAYAPKPVLSQSGGTSPGVFQVTLDADTENVEIRYTLDASDPTGASLLYTKPISISKTTVLRARTFAEGFSPSFISTATYLIGVKHDLPIVSLVTDPPNLWDWETGIYVEGPNAQSSMPHYGANYWEEWEKPVHVEFFEADGTIGFQQDAGMKIMGGWSRARDQKSLAIFARSEYGVGEFEYQIFPDKNIETFEAFTLRNSGNDWDGAFMRDGFMQNLLAGQMDLELMAFRPAAVYINGEYWGILNLREKQNEHYLASNTGVNPDNIDLLQGSGNSQWATIQGDYEGYQQLLNYLEINGAEDSDDYAYVQSQMDVDNFIEYQIANIYFDNTDWPGNNIKFWRPKDLGGRWRWLTFDTDFGFGMYENRAYRNNTLEFALEPYGQGWPNPPWSTFLLRTLIENQSFQHRFINRFADHLNTTFDADRVLDILERMAANIEEEIIDHNDRWPASAYSWEHHITRMQSFAEERVNYMFDFIEDEFDLSTPVDITLTVSDKSQGYIRVNEMALDTSPWTGAYYPEIPIQIMAVPRPGYRFVRWSDGFEGAIRHPRLKKRISWKAEFEAAPAASYNIQISEINYNTAMGFDTGDWVELYNGSEMSVSLNGWTFSDEDSSHVFIFPPETVMEPYSYLVLCRNRLDFQRYHKRVGQIIGDMSFNLGNDGDELKLFDDSASLVDIVSYDDELPWPVEADGQGKTLEIRDLKSNNDSADAWSASSVIGGTPGRQNSSNTHSESNASAVISLQLEQNYPNPFNPITHIPYTLPKPALVELRILNIRGQVIQTLYSGEATPGSYLALWDGRDTNGLPMSSGVYFVALDVKESGRVIRQTQKMILMK